MSGMLIPPDANRGKFLKAAGQFSQLPESIQLEILKIVLERGNLMNMVVHGLSMYPFIRDGDRVIVKPFGDQLPQIGDIVAFQRPENDQLIMHRVIEKEGDRYTIKGDNVFTSDGSISRSKLIGQIISVTRTGRQVHAGLGYVKKFLAWLSKHNLVIFFNRTRKYFSRVLKAILG